MTWKLFTNKAEVTGLTYAEFARKMQAAGVRKHSRQWPDYERAKSIAENEAQDSVEYQRLINWAKDYVHV